MIMKSLREYIIQEKLIINNNLDREYKYFPKNKDELIDILNEIITNSQNKNSPEDPIDLNVINTSNITDMCGIFSKSDVTDYHNYVGGKKIVEAKPYAMTLKYIDISKWDVSKVENFSYMFHTCDIVSIGDIGKWNVSSAKNFRCMFNWCNFLKTIGDISKWAVNNVTNMSGMFNSCWYINNLGNLKNWDVSNVVDFSDMFMQCWQLTDIGDVKNWRFDSGKTFDHMFGGCTGLTKMDLSGWKFSNTVKYINLNGIFHGCQNLETVGDISEWNVNNIDDFRNVFNGCLKLNFIGDISEWDVTNSKTFECMFHNCTTLKFVGDLSGWRKLWKLFIPSHKDMFKKSKIRKRPEWAK